LLLPYHVRKIGASLLPSYDFDSSGILLRNNILGEQMILNIMVGDENI